MPSGVQVGLELFQEAGLTRRVLVPLALATSITPAEYGFATNAPPQAGSPSARGRTQPRKFWCHQPKSPLARDGASMQTGSTTDSRLLNNSFT
ncbi:MAG: hypothetical protein M3Y33_15835 [Actinomycetota bacterium]|nr:hypothetical protein [Actinomycetota bacterium]